MPIRHPESSWAAPGSCARASYRSSPPSQKVALIATTSKLPLQVAQHPPTDQFEREEDLRCCSPQFTRRRLWATSRPSQSTNPPLQRLFTAESPSSTTTRPARKHGSQKTNRAHCPSSLPTPRCPKETRARSSRKMTSSCLSIQSRTDLLHPAHSISTC